MFVREHASGASLAFAAPLDQLYTATEANEWALYAALGLRADDTPVDEDDRLLERQRQSALGLLKAVGTRRMQHIEVLARKQLVCQTSACGLDIAKLDGLLIHD